MIDVNELKLSNYVFDDNMRIIKVMAIYQDGVGFNFNDEVGFVDNKFIEPIPLTEGILIKCGFVLYGYGSTDDEFISSVEFTGYRLNNYDIYFVNDTNKSIRFVNNINEKVYCNIKYLHQLQNLYWCLVGEELNISL